MMKILFYLRYSLDSEIARNVQRSLGSKLSTISQHFVRSYG